MTRLALVASILLGLVPCSLAAAPNQTLHQWLNHQTNLNSWTANVRQTRTLKSLAQPIVTSGRVWFQTPNLFRWELGDPPKTIAIREPNRLTLLYPALKRAEVYPLDSNTQGPWRDSLALLEAGFPRNLDDLQSRFTVVSVLTNPPHLEIALQPRTAAARRWMPLIRVSLHPHDLSLHATDLAFADGSRLRNEFSNATNNPTIPSELLLPNVPTDFIITTP
jgi:outer membrane lipoprotein-sorting protein